MNGASVLGKWKTWWVPIAVLFSLLSLVWHHMTILGDGFWYIATGRLINAARSLPDHDPFSFASTPGGWTLVSPLTYVVFAWIADHLGLSALMLVCTIVEAAAVFALWFVFCRSNVARFVTIPLAILFVQVDAEDLSARGQVIGDLAFVALLFFLHRMFCNRKVSHVVPLLLGALWANLHLSYLQGVVLPLGYAGAILLEPKHDRPRIKPFILFALFALLGSLCNPYGPRMLRTAWVLTSDPATAQFDLFQSPNFHEPIWLVAPAIGVILASLRAFGFGPRRGQRVDTLVLMGFVAAAMVSRRYAPQLLAVEIMVMGSIVTLRWRNRFEVTAQRAMVPFSLLMSGVAVFAWRGSKDPFENVPKAATEFIEGRHLPSEIMNPLHWGGYLGYAWKGTKRYFIDGRDQTVLYGNGSFADSAALRSGTPNWQTLLDAYDIQTVLWERGEWLDARLAASPQWMEVFRDRLAVIYVRRERKPAGRP